MSTEMQQDDDSKAKNDNENADQHPIADPIDEDITSRFGKSPVLDAPRTVACSPASTRPPSRASTADSVVVHGAPGLVFWSRSSRHDNDALPPAVAVSRAEAVFMWVNQCAHELVAPDDVEQRQQ